MTNAEVGARIRVLRQERGWTQTELGHHLDPPRSHAAVSDIERGLTRLALRDLTMIAGALDVPRSALLDGGRDGRSDRGSRRFYLVRTEDVSGVSGTGVVAEGCRFSTGKACLAWVTAYRSVAVYDSMAELEAIHGHNGATRVEWID